MPHLSSHAPSDETLVDVALVSAAFASQVTARFPGPHAATLHLEAEAALFAWLTTGPTRADRSPRFAAWNLEAAARALQGRAHRKGLARRLWVDAPASLWRQAIAACERALVRLGLPAPRAAFAPGDWTPVRTFADHVARVDARLARIRRFCVLHRQPCRVARFADVAESFALQVVSRLPDRPPAAVRDVVGATVAAWVMHGPTRADGSPRFAKWNVERAAFALTRLRRLLPRLRCRSFTVGGHVVTLRERGRFHAPRSLWLGTLAPCLCLESTRATSAAVALPAPVSPWENLARTFAEHVADARARLTATWGNARHRAALAETALDTVGAWLAVRARRTAADLRAVLLRRTARAEAAEVPPFTFWPASLLRAVRRALDLVHVVRVEVAQTVGVRA